MERRKEIIAIYFNHAIMAMTLAFNATFKKGC